MVEVDAGSLEALCRRAVSTAGGDEATSTSLAAATVAAERRGKGAVGVSHLFDYLDALRDGRLNGSPAMTMAATRAASITVSADDGVAQAAYAVAAPALVEAVRSFGVGVLSVSRTFTAGELGYYAYDLAEQGLVALACSNSPALMTLFDAGARVTGTNPLAFAIPGQEAPRMIDQASSVTAWVRVREAAEAGRPIPDGWALDADGRPTTDAAAAVVGPLLPFGGVKGSNVAVMVELLSVLSGAAFSLDAGAFPAGRDPQRVGLFVLALDPVAFDPGFVERTESHFTRLREEFGIEFGRSRRSVERPSLADDVLVRLQAEADGTWAGGRMAGAASAG